MLGLGAGRSGGRGNFSLDVIYKGRIKVKSNKDQVI